MDLRASSSRFNLIHSPSLRRSFLDRLLLRGGDAGGAYARVRIEAPGARTFHLEFGGLAAAGCRLDAERRTLQVHAGVACVDPFHARVATLVMHDLGDTAPIGRVSELPLELFVGHGRSMTDGLLVII